MTQTARRALPRKPTRRVERGLHRSGYRLIVGMDEVGRGALAGPVSVGVVLVDEALGTVPAGVRDSKLLTPARRVALVPRIRRWAREYAVGHVHAAELDRIGIMAALRLAGFRALAQLNSRPDLIILDGNHDWLTPPERQGLFAFTETRFPHTPAVTTMIKADLKCSSVAAASVLAKVERDAMMVGYASAHPAYSWDVNKGYASPEHRAALDKHGATALHRRSWNLFGVGMAGTAAEADPYLTHDGQDR